MTSRRLTVLLVRTVIAFVLAFAVAVVSRWSSFAVIAVAATGGAAVLQLVGVLWLRRTERRSVP